ncbi:hypothetical protein ACIBAG_31735 [Streptomyces sp. NPDC051243]
MVDQDGVVVSAMADVVVDIEVVLEIGERAAEHGLPAVLEAEGHRP